jgi:hypothetical protein
MWEALMILLWARTEMLKTALRTFVVRHATKLRVTVISYVASMCSVTLTDWVHHEYKYATKQITLKYSPAQDDLTATITCPTA